MEIRLSAFYRLERSTARLLGESYAMLMIRCAAGTSRWSRLEIKSSNLTVAAWPERSGEYFSKENIMSKKETLTIEKAELPNTEHAPAALTRQDDVVNALSERVQ